MSITTTSTKDSYTGNNSTSTPYPITFKYLEDSHITVYVDGVALSNSYYTLTGDGSLGTGQFTTALAYAGTQKVVVVLDVPFNQPVELLETGVLSSSTLEEAYDRLNMQIRRVWRKAQSVLTFSTDEGGAGSQGTADNLLGFDGTGNLTEIPNSTFVESSGGIDNISDVTITSPSNGEGLVWNGSAWVNSTSGNGDMLASVYDPNGVAGAIGTVQGTGATTLNIVATDEGTVAGNARGESSVDLQTSRNVADQVAGGDFSVLIGGKNNKTYGGASSVLGGESNTAVGVRSFIAGGLSNLIDADNPNAVILGGNGNQMTGVGGTNTILSARDSTSNDGFYNFVVGRQGHSGGFNGCKIFAGSSATPFTAKANQEFGVQCDNFRLELGTPAVGDVLTCNHVDGSSNWAAPAKVVYTVATLPTTPSTSDVAMVTDATATTFHSIVAGTGSNIVPVFYDGTNWRIG
jgi:hypothetical protein